MTENERVMEAVLKTRKKGIKAAIATVVKVYGSAYRREGAKMVINEYENRTGMISGGCLEADVAEVAKDVISTGQPVLKTYHMDEDVVWGLGLGCPGTVDIYIEPVPESSDHLGKRDVQSAFGRWLASINQEKACVLATALERSGPFMNEGTEGRFFISTEGETAGSLGTESVEKQVLEAAQKKVKERNPKSETITISLPEGRELPVFLDVYVPCSEIMIFGAGHDAIPVARYASSLGWKTTVVDPRHYYNSEERFPGAKRIVADTGKFSSEVSITDRTYIIVMNHHIEKDQETLKFVLSSTAPYIGVLGPRKRRDRMLKALEEEGTVFDKETLKRMHSPIGLDIGSETPEEIAISILAEIIAVKNGHFGGFLQDSHYIHHASGIVQR